MEEADHRRRTVLGDRLVAASAALNANKRPARLSRPRSGWRMVLPKVEGATRPHSFHF